MLAIHMDREKTHRKIDELATLISVNNNRMMLHEERIPQLDIDLLRKNAIELYESINLLHIQNLKDKRQSVLLEKADENGTKETGVLPEETVVEPIPEAPEPEPEQIIPEPEVAEKTVETEKTLKVSEELHKTEAVEKATPKKDKEHLYEKLTRSSIESIKKSISISKRYEMQAALFKNDPDAYNSTINKLDSCDNAEDALNYLNNELKSNYGWNDEDPLVEELYLLVERRYA